MSTWRAVEEREARMGDLATHKSGELDSRRVAFLSDEAVWLDFGGTSPGGPFPIENYSYQREVTLADLVATLAAVADAERTDDDDALDAALRQARAYGATVAQVTDAAQWGRQLGMVLR